MSQNQALIAFKILADILKLNEQPGLNATFHYGPKSYEITIKEVI